MDKDVETTTQPSEQPASPESVKDGEMVALRHFENALEAEMAQSLLQSYNIPAVIAGNEALPFGASMPVEGGIRLLIAPEDVDAAEEVLAAPPAQPGEGGAEL